MELTNTVIVIGLTLDSKPILPQRGQFERGKKGGAKGIDSMLADVAYFAGSFIDHVFAKHLYFIRLLLEKGD